MDNKKKLVCLITIIFSAIAFLLGIVFVFKYKAMASYVEVPAYVSDIETTKKRSGRSSVTVYNYTVNFTYEGSSHQYYVKESSRPNVNLSRVWIDPKTLDVSLFDRETTLIGSFIFFGMSVIWMGTTIMIYTKILRNKC